MAINTNKRVCHQIKTDGANEILRVCNFCGWIIAHHSVLLSTFYVCWCQFCFCALWAWESMSRSNNISAESGRFFLLRSSVPFFWDDNYLGDSFDDHICMQKASSMLVWSWLNLYSKSSFRSWTLSLCIVYLLHYDAIAWDSFQFYYHLSSHMTLSTLFLCDTFGHDPKTWLKPLPCVSFMRESSHNAIESGIVLNSCTVR